MKWSGVMAGLAIGWLLDPYGTLAGHRMASMREQYLATAAARPSNPGYATADSTDSVDWWERLPSFGGKDSGDGDGNPVAIAIALIALALLAIGAGIFTAILVFQKGRKKAQSQIAHALLAL